MRLFRSVTSAIGQRDRLELLVLVLVSLAGRAALVYRHGMPDPDSVAMAAGMALNASGELPLGDTLIYGRQVNPGMHMIGRVLVKLVAGDIRHIAALLNWMSVASFILIIFSVYRVFRRYLPHAATIAALWAWSFSPVVWEASTYYHPLLPATLLLLLAVISGGRIAASVRGLAWFGLTVALAAAALFVRVELLIIWPGLFVGALWSTRRRRNAGLLVIVTLLTIIAYVLLSRGLSQNTTVQAHSVTGYARVISSMYARTFSLPGLPRSITWATLCLGVGTIAACAWSLGRWSSTRTLEGKPRAAIAVGIAWALPSVLFWLPQPTPILRHYFLASIGLALWCGVFLLRSMSRRSLPTTVAFLVGVNLLLPELAYRAYNARADDPKTPNGALFYFHQLAQARLDWLADVRDRMGSCGVDSAAGKGSPHSIALVRWDVYAHVVYAVATSGRLVQPLPTEMIFPGVRYSRFRVDAGEVRLINYSYLEDERLQAIVADLMEDSQREGFCLFAPKELKDRFPALARFGASLAFY